MKLLFWELDDSEPNCCSACPELHNGVYLAHISHKKVDFVVPFCGDCAYKLGMRRYIQ